MSNRRSKPVDPIARLFREVVFPERYGTGLAPHALKLSCTNNRDSLLGAADDLHASTAWSLIEAQRGQWGRELPARRADLLPWLIEKDPGTTLLDLLAFCTGALLDGIAGDEKPHAINALASALNLDMTRYWTPTRASYFDHVSKARIAEVVASAVSPKIAADLGEMKKADAAAAAELRLVKAAWVPEILTDCEIPAAPSWHIHDDEDDADAGNGAGETEDSEDGNADAEPDADKRGGHVNNTPHDADASPDTRSEQQPWPFPTAASVSTAQADRHVE
jgi:ParB family chromosome partitioning protein